MFIVQYQRRDEEEEWIDEITLPELDDAKDYFHYTSARYENYRHRLVQVIQRD